MLEHGGSEDPGNGAALKPQQASGSTIVFIPLRRAGRRRRALLWLIGPVLWATLIAAVAIVMHDLYSVELALIFTGASLVVATVVLLPVAVRRHRRDTR